MMNEKYLLSVVIPALNEEENIRRCIESVLESTKGINCEIILVDSVSTDRTVEIAKKYPVKIIQLKKTWPRSIVAGQYIGNLFAKGKHVQFLPSDMTIHKDWFKKALPILENKENIAGVVGIPSQEPYDNYLAKQFEINFKKFAENIKEGEVEHVEGAIFFRKKILDECGSWNPYLVSDEEPELCRRVVNKGYKFYIIKTKSTHHFGSKNVKFVDILKTVNRYATSQGQVLRYSLKDKNLRKYWVSLSKSFFVISLFLMFGLLAITFSFILGTSIMIYGWLTMILLYPMVVAVKKGGFVRGILHFGDQLLKYPFILKGFLKTPRDPKTYPTDVKVIKE